MLAWMDPMQVLAGRSAVAALHQGAGRTNLNSKGFTPRANRQSYTETFLSAVRDLQLFDTTNVGTTTAPLHVSDCCCNVDQRACAPVKNLVADHASHLQV